MIERLARIYPARTDQDGTSAQRRPESRQGIKERIAQKNGSTVIEVEEILEGAA